MGCTQSAPAEEKYQFSYKEGDSPTDETKTSSLPVSRSSTTPMKSKGEDKGKASDKRKTFAAAASSAGSHAVNSRAKAKFGKAVKMSSAGNAFAKAGSKRALRIKRKSTSQYGWLAKDMTIGPGCTMDKFETKRVIGTGLMGTVLLAMWKKDETWCALKCVKKDYICRHDDGRHIQAERHLLQSVDNPFVVSLFGTFQVRGHQLT